MIHTSGKWHLGTHGWQDGPGADGAPVPVATRARVGLGALIVAQVRRWAGAIASMTTAQPESLDEAVARLAEVSAHLLDDVGIDNAQASGRAGAVVGGELSRHRIGAAQ
jgi:hypothetical protein